MPKSIQTTNVPGLDQEVDLLWKQLAALKKSITAATAAAVPAVSTTQTITTSQTVTVRDNHSPAATVSVAATNVNFDLASDFLVSAQTSTIDVLVSRSAGTVTPSSVGAANAAGTSVRAANADHVHQGVASLGVSGNLVSNTGTASAPVVKVAVPMLGADPGSPAAGDMWFRTDTLQLCVYTGAAIKRSAAFT